MAEWTPSQYGYMSLATRGISTLFGALGSGITASANNSIAQSQAEIARINAQTMELNAQGTLRAAEKNIVKQTMEAGQTKGRQKAAMAANGVALGKGSTAEITASTDLIKEMDVHTTRENATAQAWGYRMKAASYKGQAYGYEAQKTSTFGTGFGSLLSGASQIAASYLKMDQAGVFNEKNQYRNQEGYWPAMFASRIY